MRDSLAPIEVTTTELHPPPEEARPPTTGPWDWVRRNLLRGPVDAVVTAIAIAIVAFVVYKLARFVFVTGRWDIVRVNLKSFMVGRYPNDEMWRVVVVLCGAVGFGALVAGVVRQRQQREGAPAVPVGRQLLSVAGRLWPVLLGVALLLSMTSSPGPTIAVIAIIGAAVVGRIAGSFLGSVPTIALVVVGSLGAIASVWFLTRAAGWDSWGGMLLNVALAVAGIGLSFPLGVLLALGRRSKLPLVRVVSVGYIEFFRGVPLYVLLLMSALTLGYFMPPSMSSPGLVIRAVVVFTLFTAAYIAEIVRGGLQSLPKGQTEAAVALGMSPLRVTQRIVLPQALRNVIPALVGQFISLFKDTTLAGAAMGFFELFAISDAVRAQRDFQGQGLYAETASFAMLLFWIGSITMSRESQRLERKLGVGR